MKTTEGRVYFWLGGSLWIGDGAGRTQWHAHHAHQLALALRGSFRFRSAPQGDWVGYTAAIVPSHCSHQFELDSATIAHLFVEPESRAGRALAARYGAGAGGDGRGGVAELPAAPAQDAAARLLRALQAPADAAAMVATARSVVAALAGDTPEADERQGARLGRALDYIRGHLRGPLLLGEVAAAVALSESRFRHLFVAQTGSSFRAYVLWLRINVAIEAAMAGASWTEAAHAAGFADSSHLSRTHKRMFGIEPTALRP